MTEIVCDFTNSAIVLYFGRQLSVIFIYVQLIKISVSVITLQDGTENMISDGEKYVLADSSADEPNAAIFSEDNLTINGTGKLTVHGNYNNGIASKDDLKITGGNIQIYSAGDGLMGRDLVAVKDGSISIEAGGDGIKATNDTDALKGFVVLEAGTYDIKAGSDIFITSGDDGVHADASISIKGGKINITKSYEGIECAVVTISDGEVHVTSRG